LYFQVRQIVHQNEATVNQADRTQLRDSTTSRREKSTQFSTLSLALLLLMFSPLAAKSLGNKTCTTEQMTVKSMSGQAENSTIKKSHCNHNQGIWQAL
jgi:hypothetical protein